MAISVDLENSAIIRDAKNHVTGSSSPAQMELGPITGDVHYRRLILSARSSFLDQ